MSRAPGPQGVHPAARFTARAVVGLAWMLACVLGLAVLVESGLRMVERLGQAGTSPTPRFDAVEQAYVPFRVQHLHPLYFFFFPLEGEARVALSNEVCSLTREGFRGPGPDQRGDRQLAFLTGGSTVFGDGTESDAETITAHLNRLQSAYFFVNAGVPSWASAQELTR